MRSKRNCESATKDDTIKREKKSRLESVDSNSHSASSDEDDDEFIPAFTPSKENFNASLNKGDVVWAKIPRYPHWPAVICKTQPRKKGRAHQKLPITFFDESFSFTSPKIIFHVTRRNVRPYKCTTSDLELQEKASNNSKNADYNHACSLVEDYLRRRALNKIDESFWIQKKLTSTSLTESSNIDKDYPNEDQTCCRCCGRFDCVCDVLADENYVESDAKKEIRDTSSDKIEQTLTSFLPERNRRRKSTVKPYVNLIKEMKQLLYLIVTGSKPSRRHDIFMNGPDDEKRRLKLLSGVGPLDDETAQEEVFAQLLAWVNEWFGNDKTIDPVTYVADVLLPEALILSISKLKNCTYKKAERIFTN